MGGGAKAKVSVWRTVWTTLTTIDSIRSISGWLLFVGGSSCSVAVASSKAPLTQFTFEWWAWMVCAGSIGGLAALGVWALCLRSWPAISKWWRRTFGEPPQLRAVPFHGETAVLEITNEGGAASLRATGQIVDVVS